MQKFKLIIFDLDCTLADTIPLCLKAFHEALQPLVHRRLSDEEILATFGPAEVNTIKTFAPGHITEGLKAFLHHYEALHYMCPVPFRGLKELLSDLQKKQIHLALVTGKGKESTAISLRKLQLSSYFEYIETGSPDAEVKPEGVQAIFDKLPNVGKEEILYVGDSPGDIKASREAAVKVVAAAWASTAKPGELQKLLPDELFHQVKDFTQWLQERV